MRIYRQEVAFTQELEAHRFADAFFALQVERLHRNDVAFNSLLKGTWARVETPDFSPLGFDADFRFNIRTHAKERKEGQPPSTPYDLLWIHLRLTPRDKKFGTPLKYDRKILVERTIG